MRTQRMLIHQTGAQTEREQRKRSRLRKEARKLIGQVEAKTRLIHRQLLSEEAKGETGREKKPANHHYSILWDQRLQAGGENDMPDTPGDIPTVADIPGGSPIQWDPVVHPREWEYLFPGIDAFPDRSPNGSEEGAPQTEEGGATVGEATPTGATEGEATQAGGGEATPAAGGEISQRG